MLLYINGQLADLDAGQVIAQTKQVNDLNSLENRQASYTNKFKLPKTANNIRIMDFLTVTGNRSNIPYQKNECSLYGDSGECFVYRGWAIITDGGEDYEAVVYDGIIDLYKIIENKTLADLHLDAVNHTKSLQTVANSWLPASGLHYIYILADYNGKTGSVNTSMLSTPKIDIDYLVPSISVAYLWHKVFETFGFTATGKIFQDTDFLTLFMTYPKGTETGANPELIFESANYGYKSALTVADIGPNNNTPMLNKYFAQFNQTATYVTNKITDTNKIQLRVAETGSYVIEVSGKINSNALARYAQSSRRTNANIYLALNSTGTNALTTSAYGSLLGTNITSGENFARKRTVELNAGDSIAIVVEPFQNDYNTTFTISSGSSLAVKVTKVDTDSINFGEALADFQLKDFLKEIIHRFGLTMYKDKYSNAYHFLTPVELLEHSTITDFSSKFAGKISENYIYGNYAKRNWFRYKYNDKEAGNNDSYLEVVNENLEDSRNVITSATYSPDKNKVMYLRRPVNVYKLWEKEVSDATEDEPATITYKPLDNRFYFLRPSLTEGNVVRLKSAATSDTLTVSRYYIESYTGLSFKDVLLKYYNPLRKVINKSVLVTANMLFTEQDIANFDFKKRYYIDQLGGNFIMNKINNYVPGKPVKCELIKLSNPPDDDFLVQITKITVGVRDIFVHYQTSTPVTEVIVECGSDYNGVSVPWEQGNPAKVAGLATGQYTIRVRAAGKLSNSITVNIPSVQTVTAQ